MRNTLIALAAGAVIGGLAAAVSTQPRRRGLTPQDKIFLGQAAQADMAEIELSQLALTRSESPEVQRFAAKMIEDHTRAQREIKTLAEAKAIFLPRAPESITREAMGRLAQLTGPQFDHYYMHVMIKDHLQAIDAYQREKALGSDPLVVELASRLLPRLQAHLAAARSLTANAGYPLQS